jgi:prevent-host-death family protein
MEAVLHHPRQLIHLVGLRRSLVSPILRWTLGQLLDFVEQGEEIMITRHGKGVARLVPPRPMRDRDQARAAL